MEYDNIGKNIGFARKCLQNGEIIAIPTETVYGLAANGLNENAILKIFEAKNRPLFDPLILHINSIEKIQNYVLDFPDVLKKIALSIWPGPLTVLLPKNEKIPDLVTSGLSHVAFRIPNHTLTLQLLSELDFPLAAPSANPFGYISPTSAKHVANQLYDKVSYILDGGECIVGLESTIVGFENNKIQILRLGGLSIEKIKEICPEIEIEIQAHSSSNPKAPGMLKSHYAPRKPFYIEKLPSSILDFSKVAVLIFGNDLQNQYSVNQTFNLSDNGDTHEAAQKLFTYLRMLDESDFECIYMPKYLPISFLGAAINDRLKRASVSTSTD